jgi:hypothetical protein
VYFNRKIRSIEENDLGREAVEQITKKISR